MRTRHSLPMPLLALLVILFTTGLGFAQDTAAIQWAPVPADPNELVTGGAKALTNPQERSAALELLDRARQNYTLYGPHAPAFTLKVSFISNGQSQYEGQGSMQETWAGWVADRWTAKIGSAEAMRVIYRGQMWSDNPSAPVPMRVQMARSALLWPVMNTPPRMMLRAAAATIAGKAVMCILTSASMPTVDQPRHWLEQEYCVDPESGNLLVWSEAPGYYVFYDYTASTEFQGHLLANNISIYESGSRVMQIHVDSIQDASGINPESLRPTPQLMAKGPSFGLGPPMRYPILVTEGKGTIPTAIQPVLVHATIDRDGHVLEAEALQNSNPELAAKAIDTLKTRVQGRAIRQREVFVNVEFMTGSRQVAAAQ
jgi:hypothetical protein